MYLHINESMQKMNALCTLPSRADNKMRSSYCCCSFLFIWWIAIWVVSPSSDHKKKVLFMFQTDFIPAAATAVHWYHCPSVSLAIHFVFDKRSASVSFYINIFISNISNFISFTSSDVIAYCTHRTQAYWMPGAAVKRSWVKNYSLPLS